MEITPKLKEYIDNNRGSLPPVTDPDEPLQIDSLGLIRLVAFLESELGYRVEDEELVAENFASLRKLGELLATKTPTAPTAELPDLDPVRRVAPGLVRLVVAALALLTGERYADANVRGHVSSNLRPDRKKPPAPGPR